MDCNKTDNSIDFVLLWVNGDDPDWLEQFNLYAHHLDGDKRKCRFRDWDLLRYIFRAFEEYTPWVRRVHFVTWGHLPSWLNIAHTKLNIVKHSDFLDESILPVFSCNPIEINLHKIPGLAEKFVYFNDDMFILKAMSSAKFFKAGLPRDIMALDVISDSPIAHIKINDIQVIQRHFNKMSVVRHNFFKIFNHKYRFREIVKTLLLSPWPAITGFFDQHQPQPFLKSTYSEVWQKESSVLQRTAGSKIRSCNDVNQYLFRYWQLCKGSFYPASYSRYYSNLLSGYDDAAIFNRKIVSGKYEMVCINDNIADDKIFSQCREMIDKAFRQILPSKSSFEV